jgi:hypothetical protein
VSVNHHTDVSAGAAATAATLNAPLGQLDAKLTHAVTEYASTADTSTTVTTANTFYAVASLEVSFTPAYTGQVFMIALVVGGAYAGTAGASTYNLRITDGASATIVDEFIKCKTDAATASTAANAISGVRAWTAGAGDVGVTRKAKMYVTHNVNAAAVHTWAVSLQAVTH